MTFEALGQLGAKDLQDCADLYLPFVRRYLRAYDDFVSQKRYLPFTDVSLFIFHRNGFFIGVSLGHRQLLRKFSVNCSEARLLTLMREISKTRLVDVFFRMKLNLAEF